jgi:hypothetical protein
VASLRDRSLAGQPFPYVFVDATCCKARVNRRVVSQAVVVATGVCGDGRREVLGFAVGEAKMGLLDPVPTQLEGTRAHRGCRSLPLVAVRVRATVGRPGGSAQAKWRRLRAAEWAAWTRTLPWRMAAILGIGVSGAVLGRLLVPRLGLVVGVLVAIAAGWGLRFRPSPDAGAWRRGAAGERRTAHLLGHLGQQGWAVLHDLAIPGSQANLDHLVIGPGGVFVIDSKQYRGRLQFDPSGVGCGMAATRSPPSCAPWSSRPTKPPGS